MKDAGVYEYFKKQYFAADTASFTFDVESADIRMILLNDRYKINLYRDKFYKDIKKYEVLKDAPVTVYVTPESRPGYMILWTDMCAPSGDDFSTPEEWREALDKWELEKKDIEKVKYTHPNGYSGSKSIGVCHTKQWIHTFQYEDGSPALSFLRTAIIPGVREVVWGHDDKHPDGATFLVGAIAFYLDTPKERPLISIQDLDMGHKVVNGECIRSTWANTYETEYSTLTWTRRESTFQARNASVEGFSGKDEKVPTEEL